MKKRIIKACPWLDHHVYPYLVKNPRRTKFPVRIFWWKHTAYLTEESCKNIAGSVEVDRRFFGLTAKDYEALKAQLEDLEVEVDE